MLVAAALAKIVAALVHLLVTACKICQYRRLIQTVAKDVETRRKKHRHTKVSKVLICHASVGSGHTRAAAALEAAIRRRDSSVEIKVIDLMSSEYADRTLVYFYKDWYLRLVGGQTVCGDMGGHCVGFFFDRANSVQNSFTGGTPMQRRITQAFLLNFLSLVYDMKPDVVVHTHFLAPELLASLRRRHGLQIPHVTVVTDMDVHAWWYQQPTDHYFVPRGMAKHQLVADGVPEQDVTISGIPIMPVFQDTLNAIAHLDRPARRRRMLGKLDVHLDPSMFEMGHHIPFVIQMSTGRSVMEIYENLLQIQTPIVLVVVCGRQADVRSALERIEVPYRHRVALLGYTACIHELLACADVLVTKPGGLITSEALACGLMMVVVDPYPGQEERNASMLLEEGAGIWVWDYRDLRPRLDAIFAAPTTDRACLNTYKQNSYRLGRTDAAFIVAEYVLSDAPWKRMMLDIVDDEDLESQPTSPMFENPILEMFQRTTSWNSGIEFDNEEVICRRVPTRPNRLTMKDLQRMKRYDHDATPVAARRSNSDSDLEDPDDGEDESSSSGDGRCT
eukprot:TRINITY_DN49212_c0_g1_i1.p1 TRINITY_DN49212_c0_g1~~TRINITY_DN49212_c0_g1_i1.p1  ORF type:complete len:635 (+),score=89.41 TRINITY_DN49212_c0_g1_i1:220-1905(+)